MIILLNTSTQVCELTLIDGDARYCESWQADRSLAKDLLKFLIRSLDRYSKNISDIDGIGVFAGPGSFTGLRIGITVMNTLADALDVPIVGGIGDDWQNKIIDDLKCGKNQKIVLPFYGSEAKIMVSRK